MKRAFFLLLLALGAAIAHGQPMRAKPPVVQKREIQGFRVYVREDTIAHPELNAILDMLDDRLAVIKTLVSPKQFSFFQKVPIWVDWVTDTVYTMRYNGSGKWLKKCGDNRKKARCVEIVNSQQFIHSVLENSPLMVLHEFAHAYHFRVLGYRNRAVMNAFMNAYGIAKYDRVMHDNGVMHKAYAMETVFEYFAELTEAWFGDNDYFPHNREQLKEFDPVGYELMRKTWE